MPITEIFPDKIYLADESFVAPEGTVTRDDRLLGSHALVQNYPAAWSPDGTLPADRGSDLATVFAKREAEALRLAEEEAAARLEAARLNPVKLELPSILTARRDFVAQLDGVPCTVKRGSQAFADSSLVQDNLDAFTSTRR